MYRTGHYGAALLGYAPLGFALLVLGDPTLAVAGGALSLALAPLPDYDQRVPLVSHRGVTHTLPFALVVGGCLGAVGWLVGANGGTWQPATLALFGVVVGVTAVGSHLLADVITPAGIVPFWPVSGKKYTLGLARADDTLANYLLLVLGVFVTALLVVAARPALLR
ncbi:metal-dependent hydrolase [Haloarcula litorea]|uniref:metal-dependent hydrolase n=1 Tax=Haloarcula litorea TaxID=3032579 RepID=UPI0023E7688D|nr:metal-dependent hydrolase [Halomicroarcula sp. GDY20]